MFTRKARRPIFGLAVSAGITKEKRTMNSKRWTSSVLAVGLAWLVAVTALGAVAPHCLACKPDSKSQPAHPLNDKGDPISMLDGSFNETCTDFRLPGLGVDFVIQRTYTSGTVNGRFQTNDPNGVNWQNNYDMCVSSIDGMSRNQIAVMWSAQSEVDYTLSNGVYVADHGNATDKLTWNLTSQQFQLDTGKLVYTFYDVFGAHVGRLASISDKYGHTLTLNYPTNAVLYGNVVDTMGRTHTVARYGSGPFSGQTLRIWVRDTTGKCFSSIEYGYDDNGNLVRAILTDWTGVGGVANFSGGGVDPSTTGGVRKVWLYGYGNNHELQYVVDPAGYQRMCAAGVLLSDGVTPISKELSIAGSWYNVNGFYGASMLSPNLTGSQWAPYGVQRPGPGGPNLRLRRLEPERFVLDHGQPGRRHQQLRLGRSPPVRQNLPTSLRRPVRVSRAGTGLHLRCLGPRGLPGHQRR
jgi:hypothetical protein